MLSLVTVPLYSLLPPLSFFVMKCMPAPFRVPSMSLPSLPDKVLPFASSASRWWSGLPKMSVVASHVPATLVCAISRARRGYEKEAEGFQHQSLRVLVVVDNSAPL
jgi:hypothetical protein